ncbi:MAG: CHAT domain-containing protein [Magnetococcales bacterium]|nr:CHAT domain-containing protein [Magnetococcales bacterium]
MIIKKLALLSVLTVTLFGCGASTPKIAPLVDLEQPTHKANLSKIGSDTELWSLEDGVSVGISPFAQKSTLNYPPPPKITSQLGYVPPPKDKARVLSPGETHFFGFVVTKDFAAATQAYLNGEGQKAIVILDKMERESAKNHPAMNWRISHLRVMVHMQRGEIPQGEAEIPRMEQREIAILGSNLASRALRAELRMWAGDFPRAIADAGQVLQAIGDWSMPTSYMMPPSNSEMTKLGVTTEAKMRSQAVMGSSLFLQQRFSEAAPWLEALDAQANDVFYVFSHPLYGSFVKPYMDAFYGRGNGQALLATTIMATKEDRERGGRLFARATDYFNAMGYRPGIVVVESLKAWALLLVEDYEAANTQAIKALGLAEKSGLLDFVWRIEILRGEALFKVGRIAEAEESLRRGQSVVDLIIGTLRSDKAKVRFGADKEQLTKILSQIDTQKQDWHTLFEDLERGRARAFIDMLGRKVAPQGRQEKLVAKIKSVDKKILIARQRNSALISNKTHEINQEPELLKQRNSLMVALRRADPELADLFSVSTTSLENVQKELKPGEVLYYALPVIADKPLQFLKISSTNAELEEIDLTAEQLRTHLDAFTAARIGEEDVFATLYQKRGIKVVKKTAEESVADLEPFEQEELILKSLSQKLGVEDWSASKAVYIVPGGDLFFVPWGGLNIKVPVVVLPTGGWILRVKNQLKAMQQAVLVGDPAFGGVLSQLSGAKKEAQQIAQQYGSQPLIGKDATKSALRLAVGGGVDMLHLATHAYYDSNRPLQSALFLSNGTKATALTAKEIFLHPLSAQLVVLSACETGMGQVIAGDDLLGLSRSFYLGGTSTLLSSLWPVEDRATLLFMEHFHKQAKNGDFGNAWLSARDAVKKAGYPPSSYGAFNLGGSFGSR